MATNHKTAENGVSGEFVDLNGERYYLISHVDQMPPFLVSLVSDSDHWMFIASNGGMTAGRVSPETALFPYITVDNLYDSTLHTGSRALVRVYGEDQTQLWEPFNRALDQQYAISRHLYRNYLGNKILFDEVNHDLALRYRYGWSSSDSFGFVRSCEISNLADTARQVEFLDGVQNVLPAGTPRYTQTNSSYLVDAYKYSELEEGTGLALYTLYSAISDRAEPQESLRATTAFCLGLEAPRILLSSNQLASFRHGATLETEHAVRGQRGAYLVSDKATLGAGSSLSWQIVVGSELSQAQCSILQGQLAEPGKLAAELSADVAAGSDRLSRIMAAADASQSTAEETVFTHHYANVLYNVLRGGIPDDQYRIAKSHFLRHIECFNRGVLHDHEEFLTALPEHIQVNELLRLTEEQGGEQLQRLALEYLPITFGRRHGDPSRPWNQFKIELKDAHGAPLLNYQGNWRDIFQNWEALLLSFPCFAENVVAKFVNASTVDGYNPYRITSEGIDWEIEDPEDPWSYIGYWGDHQIIYLLKLMELSKKYFPDKLELLLRQRLFSYANVPYRIKPFAELLADPKSTVLYDTELDREIERRVDAIGADGKLVLDASGQVHQVNLIEKLLVPLLAKVSNLVVDGGIWLNTQRPEWNDANNALVGQGLSMVTLYYLRRYLVFMQDLLASSDGDVTLSAEVAQWFGATLQILDDYRQAADADASTAGSRYQLLARLGQAATEYRQSVYESGFSGTERLGIDNILAFFEVAMEIIDASIKSNRSSDGLYQAYNLLEADGESVRVGNLYPMLEGQVAVLSSGALDAQECVKVVENLFASALYRDDQESFLLYPDKSVPRFLEKNILGSEDLSGVPLVSAMIDRDDFRIMQPDRDGTFRFHPDIVNVNALFAVLESLGNEYGDLPAESSEQLAQLYERTFNHRAFTGRSGGMFAFEGLGSIYWHMVSKLLLAVQESYFSALSDHGDISAANQLGELYYRVRNGIGFNKGPAEYGAIPTDPYSHTPMHMGAQQPGMTGQVKEEILTRFGELGLQVDSGAIRFRVSLLREREFCESTQEFRYLDTDGHWKTLQVPDRGLAFTFCQVPVVYTLQAVHQPVKVTMSNGDVIDMAGVEIPTELAASIFERDGKISRVDVAITPDMLFGD